MKCSIDDGGAAGKYKGNECQEFVHTKPVSITVYNNNNKIYGVQRWRSIDAPSIEPAERSTEGGRRAVYLAWIREVNNALRLALYRQYVYVYKMIHKYKASTGYKSQVEYQ